MIKKFLSLILIFNCLLASEDKSNLERLIEQRKNLALFVMRDKLKKLRDGLQKFEEQIESDIKTVSSGKRIYGSSIDLMAPGTMQGVGQYIVKIEYKTSRRMVLEDVNNDNSAKTSKMINDAKGRIDAYSKLVEDNINKTYAEFLACVKKTDNVYELHKCKRLFLNSYVPATHFDYGNPKMEGDVNIEEVVAAKKKDGIN